MIVIPYTRPHTATVAAVGSCVSRYVGESDRAYFDLLADLWVAGEAFTVVEHDVVPSREALASLDDCTRDWCACPYPYLYGELHAGLGCTRFRVPLLERHPELMAVVAEMSDRWHAAGHWCRLDAWITDTLRARGETRCEAHPNVEHRMAQRGSSHGCYVIN